MSKGLAVFITEYEKAYPDEVVRIDKVTKMTESGVEVAISTQAAVVLAMVASSSVDRRRSLTELRRELEKTRPQLEAEIKAQIAMLLLYTYRNATDDEIRQYIEFSTTPAGSKYHSSMTAAIKKALTESSIRWGKAIGERIEELKGKSETWRKNR